MQIQSVSCSNKVALIGVGSAGVNTASRISGCHRVAIDVPEDSTNMSKIEFAIPVEAHEAECGNFLSKSTEDAICDAIAGCETVVLCIGGAGNIGAAMAPSIAKLAKQQDKTVIAVVFKPFFFEGDNRKRKADETAAMMKLSADCTICVLNDRLKYAEKAKGLSFADNLAVADSVVAEVMEIASRCNESADLLQEIISKMSEYRYVEA